MTATIERTAIPFTLPDFDLALAERAHSGTSMTPDVRARGEAQAFIESVNGLYADLAPLAETDEQRAVLDAEVLRYAEGLRTQQYALLQAQSRTYSTFISGPSNYPARTMTKRFATVDKRREELLDWDKRARAAVRKAVLAARSPEQAELAGWRQLRREIDKDMDFVYGYDEGTVAQYYTRSAFVTSVTGRLERRSKNGEHALVLMALDHIAERQQGWKKPYITRTNKVWKLREVATGALAAAAEIAEAPGGCETIMAENGIEILRNRDLDRVQIIFPGKPDEATRAKLRGAGWNWSPTNQAWQRKLTNAAEYSAKYVLGWT